MTSLGANLFFYFFIYFYKAQHRKTQNDDVTNTGIYNGSIG